VQTVMDATGKELTARDLFELFEREYGVRSIPAPRHQVLEETPGPAGTVVRLQAHVEVAGRQLAVQGAGNGPIDAFVQALGAGCGESIRVLDYHEHAIGAGANAQAVAYLELRIGERTLFGVGIDSNIVSASLKAIVSGLQRAQSGTQSREITCQTN
jgi:2-isopropylmalate synthase